MKKYFPLYLLLCLLNCILVRAKEYMVHEIQIVHLLDARRYVCNPDSVLSPDAVAIMDSTLYALERHTGIQPLVVVVKDISGGDCFDFAYQLGKQNGVGQKETDNGLVVLLVTEERCIQFATGYGLEGSLPDAVCKQIQIRYMTEAFGKNDWDTGMVAGIQAICKQLDGTGDFADIGEEDSSDTGEESFGYTLVQDILAVLFLIVTLLFLAFIWLLPNPLFLLCVWLWDFLHSKCPNCHKYGLHVFRTKILRVENGYFVEDVYYRCKRCKHTVCKRRKRKVPDRNSGGGRSSGSASSTGGSYGGGSYGGGSFGGGGAGSKF